MCWRLGCLFKDVSQPNRASGQDNYTKLLVIGASGMTGSAVMEAAVACVWFRVVAFTRNQNTLADNKHIKNGSVRLVEGDMLEVKSLHRAMQDIDVVFFSTTYWDTMDEETEYKQGVNVLEAAAKAHIKHLLYVGTPYTHAFAKVQCKYLIGRERVQQLVMKCGVPNTILHMGFYYENFTSVFKPHMVEPSTYAVALPMGNVALNSGSILDFAHCIAKIILQPASHIGMTIKLSTGHHTVTQLAAWLDRQFPELNFYDPKITLEQYRKLSFEGCEEICTMFDVMQAFPHATKWDQRPAYQLCPSARSFKEWLVENEKVFISCLHEDEEGFSFGAATGAESNHPTSGVFWKRESMVEKTSAHTKRLNTKVAFTTKEKDAIFERRALMCENVAVRWGFLALWRQLLDSDG